MYSLRCMTFCKSELWDIFLPNYPHSMVGSLRGYFLTRKVSCGLLPPLGSTLELVLLKLTVTLLCNCPGIYHDDKGNDNPTPKAVWMSVSKRIKDVNKSDPHSFVISRKTEREGADYLPRTEWNINWIFLLAFENVDIFICSSFLHDLFSQLA